MCGRTVIGALVAVLLAGVTAGAATAVTPDNREDGPPTLTTLSGTLTKEGEAYAVAGTEVGFGPAWYIAAIDAATDYDGDDTVETIAAELDGLVGTPVTLEGEAGRCGDFDAFTINDRPYRATTGGPPPWAVQKRLGRCTQGPEVLTTQTMTTEGRGGPRGLASAGHRGPGRDRAGRVAYDGEPTVTPPQARLTGPRPPATG